MPPASVASDEPAADRLLVRSLAANAAFSGLSGLVLLLVPGPVGGWIGVPEAGWLRALGGGLLAFGAALAVLARSDRPDGAFVKAATAADFAWVGGSAVLLVGFPDLLTAPGRTAGGVVALLVAAFGCGQALGLRRR